MEKQQKIELFSGIALLILGIILIVFIITITTKGPMCMQSPFVYGAEVLSEKNNADLFCDCTFNNSPEYSLRFDREQQWVERKSPIASGGNKKVPDDSWMYKLNFTGGEND